MKKKNYPFSAIVGQEEMKKALLLNIVMPSLGGVLIKGEKGTAKSTAVRAAAGLLPAMRAVRAAVTLRRRSSFATIAAGRLQRAHA